MALGCVWIIGIGEVDGVAQTVAAQLKPYGLAIEGQKWPIGEKQAWLASADAAAAQAAHVVIVIASKSDFDHSNTRRELAFFRLALQTQLGKPVAGSVILTDAPDAGSSPTANTQFSILGDWEVISGGNWAAKVVARFHAPRQPKWPVKLGLIAREKLGVWLTVSPLPINRPRAAWLASAAMRPISAFMRWVLLAAYPKPRLMNTSSKASNLKRVVNHLKPGPYKTPLALNRPIMFA